MSVRERDLRAAGKARLVVEEDLSALLLHAWRRNTAMVNQQLSARSHLADSRAVASETRPYPRRTW
jgi:hypothetical protein